MSSDIRMGKKSRKILTIAAAVLAVALMLVVPFTAVDTDAAFTADDAGYTAKAENPTDAEILEYAKQSRAAYLLEDNSTRIFLKIFNLPDFGTPEVTQTGDFKILYGEGWKIENDSTKEEMADDLSSQNITMVFTATDDGVLILDGYEYLINYQAAADAIIDYLGNAIHPGDTLTVKGNLKSRYATQTVVNYAAVDDTKSVVKDLHYTYYHVYGVDVTIELKSGSNAPKSISFHSDKKYVLERDCTVDYKGKEYSELQPGDKCKYVYGTDRYSFESGSSYFTVNGTNYGIEHGSWVPEPGDEDVEFITDSAMNLDVEKAVIALIPASSGNVIVDKTYAAVDTAVAEVAADVVLGDILRIVLIIGAVVIGVIVIIVILIIVLVVLKKKKKKQQ